MKLLVDTREPINVKTYAISIGFDLQALPAGDFALYDEETKKYKALIERKDIADLAQSIGKRNVKSSLPRVFQQTEKMKKLSDINYLMITGSLTTLKMRMKTLKLDVHENVVYGAIASMIVRSAIEVIWVSNAKEGVKIAYDILTKIGEGKYLKAPRLKLKSKNCNWDVLAEVPGISNLIAILLIDEFGSIAEICKRTSDELQEVSGIGKIKAEMIYDFLHTK